MPTHAHSTADSTAGPSGIFLPVTAFSRHADRLIGWCGEAASLLWTVLVLVIVFQVVLRYVFGLGSIMLEETQWHLYAVGFMLGLSFTEVRERNVRIDVLAENFSQKTRLWIELFGITVFLLSFTLLVIWFAMPFVVTSWQLNEVSAAPGGLPYRWVLKSFLVTAFALLALAGLSRLTRVWVALFGR
ncbi:MAG TPA: C4-dicarboxylate ABC transporter permease [Comamonadaceae bacterium]|nr:C4-dicarboxylate ABC transporter permease [Comamonadaceae bacterium]